MKNGTKLTDRCRHHANKTISNEGGLFYKYLVILGSSGIIVTRLKRLNIDRKDKKLHFLWKFYL